MKKRRVTLNLDEEVVEALQGIGERAGRSLSSVASDALRDAVEGAAHRAALLQWLDELNSEHGTPTTEDYAAADAFLDALDAGEVEDVVSERRRILADHERAAR